MLHNAKENAWFIPSGTCPLAALWQLCTRLGHWRSRADHIRPLRHHGLSVVMPRKKANCLCFRGRPQRYPLPANPIGQGASAVGPGNSARRLRPRPLTKSSPQPSRLPSAFSAATSWTAVKAPPPGQYTTASDGCGRRRERLRAGAGNRECLRRPVAGIPDAIAGRAGNSGPCRESPRSSRRLPLALRRRDRVRGCGYPDGGSK